MKWIDALGMDLWQRVFKNVKLQNLWSLISFIQERKCWIGNSLVKRGQPCDGVYIIQGGKFSKILDVDLPEVVSIIGEGEIIGANEVLNKHKTYRMTVKCLSAEGSYMFLPKEQVIKYARNRASRSMAEKIQKVQARTEVRWVVHSRNQRKEMDSIFDDLAVQAKEEDENVGKSEIQR